jgi:alpha-galactosidase/6-phospho-beta-glucosidase family protein
MNHLAWNIEQWEKSLLSLSTVNSFDLLYNDYIPFNHNKFNKILDLYERFNREYKTLKAQNKFIERVDGLFDDLSMWEIKNTKPITSDLFEQYRQQAKKICPNEQELANYAVKIVYDLYPNRDKTFAWTIAEEGLLKNLKPDGKIYKVKSTQNREGTEYLGRWYKLEEF